MRTTIIPAQITTVEDKIAGSLNMTQTLIMMFPVLWTALVYILLFPSMKLTSFNLGYFGPTNQRQDSSRVVRSSS